MYFVINKSINNQYYFNIKADNGEIICTSETYIAKQSAEKTINLIKNKASDAVIVDMTK